MTTFGGLLVGLGIMDATQVSEFIGGGCAVLGIVWSIMDKVKVKKMIDGYEVSIYQVNGKAKGNEDQV